MDVGARLFRVATLVAGAIALGGCAAGTPAPHSTGSPDLRTGAARQHALAAFGRRSLSFSPNAGQMDRRVRYLSRTGGSELLFGDRDVTFVLRAPSPDFGRGLALRLSFIGADPGLTLVPGAGDGGTVTHLVGDPRRWRRGLRTRAALVYRGVWPGVDLVFSGRGGTLKYELHVAPGADVRSVRLAYAGARSLAVGSRGQLEIRTALGTLADAAPVSYQRHGGRRVAVDSRYDLRGGAAYGFALGAGYDPTRALVIDPGIDYSTFLGGTDADEGMGIAVDERGSVYVAGRTLSADYPATPGVFDAAKDGPYGSDAFVTKLDPSGSEVVYSTFVGGGDNDEASAIALGPDGTAYITGQTWSADFPTTVGAPAGGGDAFVTGLTADGSALTHSARLGGAGRDAGLAIAAAERSVYVTGFTASADFPTTAGGLDQSFNGTTDAFVTKLDAETGALGYSTFVGGSGGDAGFGIAVDDQHGVHFTGRTSSADYPTTPDAFDSALDGAVDAVVTKLRPDGSALAYSTLLGGAGLDAGTGIAVDSRARAHVTGLTASGDYPATPAALDTSFNGVTDAFVTTLSADGTRAAYSTFLGGSGRDEGLGIAVDEQQRDYVTGQTWSADHPTTRDAVAPALGGLADAFVARLGAWGSELGYSTFLGGTDYDAGRAVAVDQSGRHVYVTGQTLSADLPVAPAAFDTDFNGGRDAFVTKLGLGDG
jgi:hypothetical protein